MRAAQQHFERTVTLLQHDGTPDPLLAVVYHNLANVDLERGDLDAAQRNSTKAHDLFVQLLGEQHPMVAHPLGGLGDVALRQGALVEASARYTKALALMEAASRLGASVHVAAADGSRAGGGAARRHGGGEAAL
jgi:predicted negative regulator of RcsB-dependent stress response